MCTFKKGTKKLLGLALISGAAADAAAYTNLFTKTSHYEGNKVVAKIGLATMAVSLVAAAVNEKYDIKLGRNNEEDEVIDDNFDDFDDDFESEESSESNPQEDEISE